MKICIVQESGRHKENAEFRECLSFQKAFILEGHEVFVWGLNHPNYQDGPPDFNKFDIVLNLENYDDQGWLPNLSNCKTVKLIWSIDAQCRGIAYYQNLFDRDKAHAILFSTRRFVKDPNHHFWFPNAFDPSLIKPIHIQNKYDVGFCGSLPGREKCLEVLKKYFRMKIDIRVLGYEMVRAINSYKVAWNKNEMGDINYRNFEVIGCGVPLVTNANEQYRELGFIDMFNCAIYSNEQEMIDKIRLLLADRELRLKIAKNGFKLAQKHTYRQRVKPLIEIAKNFMS